MVFHGSYLQQLNAIVNGGGHIVWGDSFPMSGIWVLKLYGFPELLLGESSENEGICQQTWDSTSFPWWFGCRIAIDDSRSPGPDGTNLGAQHDAVRLPPGRRGHAALRTTGGQAGCEAVVNLDFVRRIYGDLQWFMGFFIVIYGDLWRFIEIYGDYL